jgi:glycosyltransferase involved in cell wall biosynthesis
MAEAMSMGKPVIGTGYSGNTDFMTPANSYLVKYNMTEIKRDFEYYKKGYFWADPDLDHAAELMRFVYENQEAAKEVGRVARQDLMRNFRADVVGGVLKERLLRLAAFGKIAGGPIFVNGRAELPRRMSLGTAGAR